MMIRCRSKDVFFLTGANFLSCEQTERNGSFVLKLVLKLEKEKQNSRRITLPVFMYLDFEIFYIYY
jgi:mannitol-1-phosphate/altronate dehydrogenase